MNNTIKCDLTSEWCDGTEKCHIKECDRRFEDCMIANEEKCGIRTEASCKACSDERCELRLAEAN